jgi:paraquat-inducible protein B
LHSDNLGSLGIGSPVYYRRLNVGQVIAYSLAGDGTSFQIKVFVNAPYDKYVLRDTRFWDAGGVNVSLGANGLTVRTQSVVSVLIGGIAFEVPPWAAASAEPAPANTIFKLYRDRTVAFAKVEKDVQHYVLFFNESMRGLSVGAPVNFLGLPVGEVTDIGLEFNPATFSLRPRVEVAIYPDRFIAHLSKAVVARERPRTLQARHAFVQRLIDRGLRAQLQTGSIISGQLFVALAYFPNAPKARIDWSQDPPQMPSVPGGLAPFETKLLNILTKLEKMPLEDISRDLKEALQTLNQTLQGVNQIVTRVDGEIVPEVKKTIGTLDRTLQDTDKIVNHMDVELVPEAKKTLEDLRRSVASAQRVLANTDTALLGPDAPAQQNLRDALKEIARAARDIRLLADYLERNPGALIRGKEQEKP